MEEPLLQTARLILLGWGVTSFGSVHGFGDHVIAMFHSPTTAASPPGLGYVTAISQGALGLLVMGLTLLLQHRSEPEPDDPEAGRDGFTLAA